MDAKIEEYKSMLTYITVAQIVQLHKNVAEQIEPFVRRISAIIPAFITYKSDSTGLDVEFTKKNKSVETDELKAKDNKRDSTTVQLIFHINYHFKFPTNENETKATHILKFIIEKYKDTSRKEYETETSLLRSMVAELRMYPEYLILFGLTSLVDKLDKENNEFDALYIIRTNFIEANREHGILTELVAKVNNSFDIQSKVINSLSMTPLNADTKAALNEIISIINGQINQYTLTCNRHAAVVAPKKKYENTEKQQE